MISGRSSALFVTGLFLALTASQTAKGVDFYASPAGTSSGDGSQGLPWDLNTALHATSKVKPGDTVWLRGGVYKGNFSCTLLGSASAPIKVRGYPNERPILDGNMSGQLIKNVAVLLVPSGGYVWFWGFEITNSDPERVLGITGSNPQERRGNGIDVYAPGVKLINLVIYDAGQGMGGWSQAQDMEAYGNLVFNNGWWAPDRGHGHGLYTQNDVGQKLYKHNVLINQFGNTVSMYGSSAAFLRNFVFDGNVLFNGRVLMGGNTPVEGLLFKNNLTYNTTMDFGYGAPNNTGIDINNNYLAGGLAFKEIDQVSIKNNFIYNVWQNASISIVLPTGATLAGFDVDFNQYYRAQPFGNDFWQPGLGENFSQWQSHGKDLHGTYLTTAPPNTAFVQKNQYDSNRALVTVYNWSQSTTASVDVSSVLKAGDRYELRSVLDYFGDVISGTYNGGQLTIPMANHTFAIPLGYNQITSYNTYPEFGAFILIKLPAGVKVTAISPATNYLEPSQTAQLTASVNGTTNTAVTWSVSPSRGTISSTGLYTAPPAIPAAETIYATARSVADPTQSMSVPITLFPTVQNIGIGITPATITLQQLQQVLLNANVTGTTTPGVLWSMSPQVGTLSSTGLYTAPSSIPTPQTVTITATSVIDPTKSSTSTINLVPLSVSVSLSPSSVSLQAAKTAVFVPTVTGTTITGVTWSLSPNTGTITTGGLYTAPPTVTTAQTVTITATSVVDPTVSGSATINLLVTPIVAVSVSPATVNLQPPQTQQFTATVTNTTNTGVNWSLSPAIGLISATGLYTSPATVTSVQTITVTGTSVADLTKSATAIITLSPSTVAVAVSPTAATLGPSQTSQFRATVTGTSTTGVNWSISPTVGAISATGLYTAPSSITTTQSVTVTAASVVNPLKTGSAIVTLSPTGGSGGGGSTPVSVTVSPTTGTVQVGNSLQLTSTVSGSTNTGVSWTLSPALGSISSSGLYTAPSSLTTTGSPAFTMGTYLGGTGVDNIRDARFDSAGNVVVVGYTQSATTDFPTATKLGTVAGQKVIVAKVSPTGALLWVTLIGGSASDEAHGLVLDSSDNVYISGFTTSTDFPTTSGAYSRTHSGGTSSGAGPTDAFALKLSPDGKQLLFSTFLGGSGNENIQGGLDLDSANNVYVVGSTESTNFLGTNTAKVNSYLGGSSDGFLVKLAADGSKVLYARFLGGSNNTTAVAESAVRVKVDSLGQAHVAAVVGSTDAATTVGSYSRTLKGGADTYLVKLSSDGKQILYGTYLGGSGYEYEDNAMAMDSAGNVYVAGYTTSTNFPTLNAQQATAGGSADLYLSKIGTSGQLLFSTYIGGSGSDGTVGSAGIDSSGNVYLFGTTSSSNLGVTANALQPTMRGTSDGFLRVYNSSGQMLYSSYFGGTGVESGRLATVNSAGTIAVVGDTASSDLPTTAGAFDRVYGGNSKTDGFIATFTGIPSSSGTSATVIAKATSLADTTKSASSTITITQGAGVAVSMTPGTATLQQSQTQQFGATVTGSTNTSVTWSISPAVGTVSTSGLYTAPASITSSQTITVKATSVADATKFATATVTLTPPAAVAVTLTPGTATLQQSQTQQFSATVTGATNTSVTWSISPAVGAVSTSGLYTAPTSITSTQTVTVKATSVADATKSATATVTLTLPVAVSMTPGTATLQQSQTQQFSATVTGSTNTSVTWSISPAVGAVSTSGLYTAPASITSTQTVTVKATSVADATKSASATVTLTPPVAVSMTPGTATLQQSQTQQFSVTVTGSTNTSVTWSINPAAGGISSSGLYTAPAAIASGQTVTITATSVADPAKSATATVTLVPPVVVSVTPGTATLQESQTQQFLASVTGSANTAVTWTLSPAIGSISSAGLYAAPASVPTAQIVTVTATSAADPTKSATATISLLPAISVSVTPGSASLSALQTVQFTATVTGSANTAVSWSLSAGVGTISASGLYTAPALITIPQTITVFANSVADPLKSATATVTLVPTVNLGITPLNSSLSASQTQQFTATVAGTTNTAVNWSLSPNVGTISSTGLYTAPSSIAAAQNVTVTATSVADPSKFASATVMLTATSSMPSGAGNLLVDSGFEGGGVVWYAADHGGRSIVSTPTYAGSGALQALVSDMFDRVVYQEIPVVAGQTMTASAWLQTSGVVAGASIDLMWLNATGLSDSPSANNIVRTDLVGTVTGTTPWTNLAGQFVAPAGAKCVRVRLYTKKAPTPTGAAWFDEIFLQ